MNALATISPPLSLLDRPGLIDDVIARTLEHKSIFMIAKELGMPPVTLYCWLRKHHAEEYAGALAVVDDILAHDALSIADEQKEAVRNDGSLFDPDVSRDTLRVNTRLKLIGRGDLVAPMLPFGDGRRPIEVIHRVIIDNAITTRSHS